MERQKKLIGNGFNSNVLKLIAIIAMTIDHVAWAISPNYPTDWYMILLHIIGRLTAPIMWYMIAEGYHYTHNIKKYLFRLGIFAVISHFAYNFAFGISFIPFKDSVFNQTSIMWSLFWGVIALMICDDKRNSLKQWQRTILIILICAITFCSDWSCIAVLAIVAIGTNRDNFKKQSLGMMFFVAIYAVVYFFFIDKVYGIIQLFAGLAIPMMTQYNGQRGKLKNMKWFFYVYYPLHLVLIGLIRIYLN